MRDGAEPPANDEEAADILYYIERLEEVVAAGKRVPFSNRVMVDEAEFLAIVDQLRETVPTEIRRAQRVIMEREAIIGKAQQDASHILETARQTADYIVSQQGVLNEARQRGEELLLKIEEKHQLSVGEINQFALEQFSDAEQVIEDTMAVLIETLRSAIAKLEAAKRQVRQ